MTTPNELKFLEFETGPNPQATIVVMHGLGADATDFTPFVREMDLSAVGSVRWVFPSSPRIPVSINDGYLMPAWYDIYPDRTQEDEVRMRQSQALLEQLLRREMARGVCANRIVLGGFSQGCAMALLTGLRFGERLAGIVAMSGYLPLASKLAAERSAANQDVPIFMAHGSDDPMIVLPRAVASRDAMTALGYHIDWREYRMPHSVCPQEVSDLNQWLLGVLSQAA